MVLPWQLVCAGMQDGESEGAVSVGEHYLKRIGIDSVALNLPVKGVTASFCN